MQIEIDQSGKIEQTSLDTVIALTNGVKYALLFKKKDKRVVEREYKKLRLHKIYMVIIFANLVSIVIKNNLGDKCPTIKFGFVGKESKSDELARKVSR